MLPKKATRTNECCGLRPVSGACGVRHGLQCGGRRFRLTPRRGGDITQAFPPRRTALDETTSPWNPRWAAGRNARYAGTEHAPSLMLRTTTQLLGCTSETCPVNENRYRFCVISCWLRQNGVVSVTSCAGFPQSYGPPRTEARKPVKKGLYRPEDVYFAFAALLFAPLMLKVARPFGLFPFASSIVKRSTWSANCMAPDDRVFT